MAIIKVDYGEIGGGGKGALAQTLYSDEYYALSTLTKELDFVCQGSGTLSITNQWKISQGSSWASIAYPIKVIKNGTTIYDYSSNQYTNPLTLPFSNGDSVEIWCSTSGNNYQQRCIAEVS